MESLDEITTTYGTKGGPVQQKGKQQENIFLPLKIELRSRNGSRQISN